MNNGKSVNFPEEWGGKSGLIDTDIAKLSLNSTQLTSILTQTKAEISFSSTFSTHPPPTHPPTTHLEQKITH